MDNNLKQRLEESNELLLQFDKRGGLLPVVVQEYDSGQILMLAYLNEVALNKTIETGKATFWSTSRNELWTKGMTSGDYLIMENILVDCDQDAVVFQVTLEGDGVCHTFDENKQHRKACFYRSYNKRQKSLQFLHNMK